jgi:hypothetical protein
MARGWESKSIEAQQEEAARAKKVSPPLSPADRTMLDRRRTLQLARARAEDDLSRATAPAHRRMLEQTLTTIDEQLSAITRQLSPDRR